MPLGNTIRDYGGVVGRTRYECSVCGRAHRMTSAAARCCSHQCPNCGNLHMYPEDAEQCCAAMWQCQECGSTYDTQEGVQACCREVREERERLRQAKRDRYKYPPELIQAQPEYMISVPAIAGRPARTISVEQELSDGARRTARMLYEMRVSQLNDITNYRADCAPGEVIVKEDGSLDRAVGGEVLYSRFNLSENTHYTRFSKVVWAIRQLRNLGLAKTDRRAGTHIHIGVVPIGNPYMPQDGVFGPAQMAALYEIFTFCEDVLFRLAAAGWREHRGTQYTQIWPREEKISPGKLMKNAVRSRHFSLNFQRLLNAVRGCTCGACVVGDWAECECGVLAGGTVEWRVFNATTKPETLHAWLLLASALTAKAFDYQLGDLKPNGFHETETSRHGWILGWILNECPLTNTEKQIILGLAKRSPGLVVDWDSLEASLIPDTDSGDDESAVATAEGITLV